MRADAADVDADRRVELQRAAAGRGFGIAEHHADLLAELVDEDQAGLRLRDDAGELAERLRHQARLQAHLRFAHLAFDFGARHERGDRVDDDDVDAVRAHEDFDDLERLLAVVGLRDQQVVEVDAELLRVLRVEGVLGVDERRHAAELLRFGDDLQRERRLARRFRAEDLDDAPARHAADSEGIIEADRPGGDGRDGGHGILLAQAHDRALAELFLDLADGHLDGLEAFAVVLWRHSVSPSGCERPTIWRLTRLGILGSCRGESQAKICKAWPIIVLIGGILRGKWTFAPHPGPLQFLPPLGAVELAVSARQRLRPERGAQSPRESERGWAASAKATASCAEAARRRGPASIEKRLRPERGAQSPRESERGWGPASIE